MGRQISFPTIVIGQNSLLREGCTRILRSANFRILDSVSGADDLQGKVHADPVLCLIVHAGDEFGLVAEQIKLFRKRYPDARIAIVADRYRPNELVSAFRAGASGYFVEGIAWDVFLRSLELVMMGETVVPTTFLPYVFGPEERRLDDNTPDEDDVETIIVANDTAPQLSPRERLILRCLIEGDSNKVIARKIDIAEATVKVHVKAILRKIRVHNRTQAAIWGMSNGWQSRTAVAIAPPLSPEIAKPVSSSMGPSSAIEEHHGPMTGVRSGKSR